ncbi:F-box protein [Apostasia shenzhenica]|uniref:F-box protein n=1 Tax=Apostasia shenzhenica TaxID=1088818 RepID=A0A2I0B5Z6_9ASPA|nr:F-box protein [Apostasia shenzhenica]
MKENKPWWNLLQEDLLCSIVGRLAIADYTRMCAVCREWNGTLSRETKPNPRPEFPWLLLPSNSGELTASCSFLSIPDRRRYDFTSLPEVSGRRWIGSKDGWLVTLDLISLQPRILNPLTREEFSLPCLPTNLPNDDVKISRRPDGSAHEFWDSDPSRDEYPISEFADIYLRKIVLSTVPFGVTVLLCGIVYPVTIALAKPGDNGWSQGPKRRQYDYFEDVVFCKNAGKFYVVTSCAAVLSFNVDGLAVFEIAPGGDVRCTLHNKYIFCCPSGLLLQVWRVLDYYYLPNGDDRSMTVEFKLYKMNPDGKGNGLYGVEVKDLGDQCLFLGGRNSSRLMVAENIHGSRAGCIYFTEDLPEALYYSEKTSSSIPFMDVGWFDVRERKVGRYFPLLMAHSRSNWPAPIWFFPSIV